MANGHGGARPGAGRKRKAEKFEGEVAAAERRIADRLPRLIDNLFKLADGVAVERETRDGVEVFESPPDRDANKYLIDRILGRPTERVEAEHSGALDVGVHVYLPHNDRGDAAHGDDDGDPAQ
jgi:hypothetical protein